ncbi:MAG: family 78 glycoside hydrolase catalytic domain [Planctomycetota bacterium]|nr:family 78 glycoside hydrolase catalytic domain [Planctomycetota bacterium]
MRSEEKADDSRALEGFARSRRWRARWIWAPGGSGEKNSYWYFRIEFPSGLDARRIFITADTRYELFLDGEFLSRGAPMSQPYFQYYDEYEIPGANASIEKRCLAVLVNHIGTVPDTRGGLLVEVTDGNGNFLLGTDERWRVLRAEAWKTDTYRWNANVMAPYQEHFDSRLVPDGWNRPGFDDSSWMRAIALRGRTSDHPPSVPPWTRLLPSDIPARLGGSVRAARVVSVEECLNLAARPRPDDLSPGLSQAGCPLRYARAEGVENLLREGAGAAVFQCSTQHEDRIFDGIYDPCVLLDFGRVVTGRPRIFVEGPSGAAIEIGYAERLIDGRFNNSIEGAQADRCVLRGGAQVYRPFAWKAFRYLKIRIRDAREPVIVRRLEAELDEYPFEESGGFESGDGTLNGVFRISRDTLRLCSHDCLMDTPWREQAQWLGDVAAVTLPGILSCFGDLRLTGKFLRQAAANRHATGLLANISNTVDYDWQYDIADYSLWWVMALWDFYIYSGDARYIHELYPIAAGIIAAHREYVNDDGFIEDMPYWVFIDWAAVDRRGECAALNAIFRGALAAFGKMAAMKGDWREERLAGLLGSRLDEAFQRRFYDPSRGCLADARVDGALSEKVSEHANMAAIRWGLVDPAAARDIARRLYEDGAIRFTEAQPFFSAVSLAALRRIGRTDLALDLIRRRWGQRMLARGATSTWEEWYMNGSWRSGEFRGFLRSHSHAWSAGPADFLIRGLAGIEILEPGCAKIAVSPFEAPFDYKVRFPTPRGTVSVAWEGGRARISVPPGIEAVGEKIPGR